MHELNPHVRCVNTNWRRTTSKLASMVDGVQGLRDQQMELPSGKIITKAEKINTMTNIATARHEDSSRLHDTSSRYARTSTTAHRRI